MERIIQIIKDRYNSLNSGQKRLFAVACTVLFSLILTISVLISFRLPVRENTSAGADRISNFSPVPAAELFFPDEPDYIPSVIPQRQQRTEWTAEDAADFWQDPLIYGEELWREKIEIVIDEILERVP